METRIRLITRGDDLASCEEANAGIAASFDRGLLRNTSVMAVGPAFEGAVAVLRERPDLSVGVHVSLNSEWDDVRWGPVLGASAVPSLVRADGTLARVPSDLHDAGASLEEMVAEAKAQLARLRGAGVRVSYLDEHMGVGWVLGRRVAGGAWEGGLRAALSELCKEEGLIDGIGWTGLRLPEAVAGESIVDRWIRALDFAEPGTYLLVTHPCVAGPGVRAFSHGGVRGEDIEAERTAEAAAWCDPRFVEYCQRTGVRAVSYAEAAGV